MEVQSASTPTPLEASTDSDVEVEIPATKHRSNSRKHVLQLCAGAGAGAITKTAIAPLERVKILFQIQSMRSSVERPKYTSIVGTLRNIVQEDGVRGFYRGNGTNVLRVVPVYALKFGFNDTFKDWVRRSEQDVKDLNFSQLIQAGSLAGLCQIGVTYPLEVVRTRLSLCSAWESKYRGIVHCAMTTVRHEGVAALYKGIGPSFLTGAPYVGIQMTSYELFKRRCPHDPESHRVPVQYTLVCGTAAGLIAQTSTYWGDTLRRRMQTNGIGGRERHFSSSWDCARKLWRTEGIRGFHRGLSANVIRCIPGAAIQFTAYDQLKRLLNAD
eukprot:438448_1